MVFHKDPLGIIVFLSVHLLLLYGDIVVVYYVIEYGGEHEGSGRTIMALFVHLFYIMAAFSHLRAAFSNPGYVPQSRIKIDFSSDIEQGKKKRKKELPSFDEWTVCTKCETYRPPRSHHCRICGRCVRRMDHHCPWINNCVGELNFKYFYLFLVYTDLLCCYAFILVLWDWVSNWHKEVEQGKLDRILTLIVFFEIMIFGVFLGGMIFAQTLAVLCNRNAIEIRRYGRPMSFPSVSKISLVTGVCGRGSKICWIVPCVTAHIPEPIPPSDKFTDVNQFI